MKIITQKVVQVVMSEDEATQIAKYLDDTKPGENAAIDSLYHNLEALGYVED